MNPRFAPRRGGPGGQDHAKYLADALGITLEKLQVAEEAAGKAELAQAVTDGRLTQAQADQMAAERALHKYIADKGLFKAAVESAVKDGVITQPQADQILSRACSAVGQVDSVGVVALVDLAAGLVDPAALAGALVGVVSAGEETGQGVPSRDTLLSTSPRAASLPGRASAPDEAGR